MEFQQLSVPITKAFKARKINFIQHCIENLSIRMSIFVLIIIIQTFVEQNPAHAAIVVSVDERMRVVVVRKCRN